MSDDQARPAPRVTLVHFNLHVFLHAVVWLGLTFVVYVPVQRFKKIFTDFGVELPIVAQIAFSITDFLPFALLPLLVVDWLLLASMGRQPNRRLQTIFWSVLMFTLPFVLAILVSYAVFEPLTKLISELSG